MKKTEHKRAALLQLYGEHSLDSRQVIGSIQSAASLTLGAAALFVVSASAQQLAPNGFGNNRLVTFTYLLNFDCVDHPMLDLDFNGILAQSDPDEMQTPVCQPITEPTQDPAGGDIKHTAHLYVLLPMFSVDGDQNPNDAIPCPKTEKP
jgi:hypothetical protein